MNVVAWYIKFGQKITNGWQLCHFYMMLEHNMLLELYRTSKSAGLNLYSPGIFTDAWICSFVLWVAAKTDFWNRSHTNYKGIILCNCFSLAKFQFYEHNLSIDVEHQAGLIPIKYWKILMTVITWPVFLYWSWLILKLQNLESIRKTSKIARHFNI